MIDASSRRTARISSSACPSWSSLWRASAPSATPAIAATTPATPATTASDGRARRDAHRSGGERGHAASDGDDESRILHGASHRPVRCPGLRTLDRWTRASSAMSRHDLGEPVVLRCVHPGHAHRLELRAVGVRDDPADHDRRVDPGLPQQPRASRGPGRGASPTGSTAPPRRRPRPGPRPRSRPGVRRIPW